MSDALINGLAGAGGGIIAQLITYPLQTVNTRQQMERSGGKADRSRGTVERLCQVIEKEGWGSLYGGLTPSIVGTAASQHGVGPVYLYDCRTAIRNRAEAAAIARNRNTGVGDGSIGMFSSLVVAALSGCVNVLLTNPIWVVVTRMQTHTKASKKVVLRPAVHISPGEIAEVAVIEPPPYGTSHAVQEVFDEAGVLGFWKGVVPTLIMVSNPSIQFMLYETMLKKLKAKRTLSENYKGVTALEVFLLGAVAKLGATLTTYPLNVVKSRLQAKQLTNGDKSHYYKGTIDAVVKMIHYEGIGGFYKGLRTKIVQSVLAAAVLFMVKEEIVKAVRLLLGKDVGLT